MGLDLVTVACLSDNYAFLARDEETGTVALVDAPEAAPIEVALAERGWSLDLILITHHHDDHILGVEALRAAHGTTVIGAAADAHRLPPLNREVREGDSVAIGASEGRVIDVSGHSVGHIAYHFAEAGVVFTGDSLMAMGCGRVFEGTKPQMWESLAKLIDLPADTVVCSGHEYTEANVRFALTVEPGNDALQARAKAVAEARSAGRYTVPSTLAEELATNPFVRAGEPALQAAVGMAGASAADVFAEVRTRKDNF
ncbi:MAG: hydroxyacylglutathione hydrolase [Pseudomonadota bacterium]